MEVWSSFKYIMILKIRWNLILEMHVIYFAVSVAHIDNSKSNVIFMRNLLRVFFPPIIIESNKGT